eukprot:5763780-Ditylum_brightwellii.AAC.1
MATEEEAPTELKVRIGRDPHLLTIERKEPMATIKQLGVKTSPAGDFSQAHKTLSVTNFTKAQCLDIMRPVVK